MTNSTHLWSYNTFQKANCSILFFLIQVGFLRHITYVLYARNPQHHKHLSFYLFSKTATFSQLQDANHSLICHLFRKPSFGNLSSWCDEYLHILYHFFLLVFQIENVCLNQGNVLLPLVGNVTVSFTLLIVKKPRILSIYSEKWLNIKELGGGGHRIIMVNVSSL